MSENELSNEKEKQFKATKLMEIAQKMQSVTVDIQNSQSTAIARASELRQKRGLSNILGAITGKNKKLRDDMNHHMISGQKSITELTELVNASILVTTDTFESFAEEVVKKFNDIRSLQKDVEEMSNILESIAEVVSNNKNSLLQHDSTMAKLDMETTRVNKKINILAIASFLSVVILIIIIWSK